ncbi:MAG: SIMPL domain-containing protein [Candidatus Dormibacteraeota bacterium]|nr:SIMPL domain-containing protein [Candidatus Dormibacteraeota bacterium]
MLTVRGEATRTVPPDVAILSGAIVSKERSRAEAMAVAAAAQGRLTDELARLGAVPLTVDTERSPLTWSAFSTSTYVETEYSSKTKRTEATGRIVCTIRVRLTVRELGRLKEIGSVLAHHEMFDLHQVAWYVDDDNPGWSAVRRDAIWAAVRKAQDYAGAVGASLVALEQVADTGLLEESPRSGPELAARAAEPMAFAGSAATRPPDEPDAPSLDPVPQQLWAMVEARFRSSPATLTS